MFGRFDLRHSTLQSLFVCHLCLTSGIVYRASLLSWRLGRPQAGSLASAEDRDRRASGLGGFSVAGEATNEQAGDEVAL